MLSEREASDVEIIAVGAVSPLTGFMRFDDYESVVNSARLSNGLPWSIPITVSVSAEDATSINEGDEVALHDPSGLILALLKVESKFKHNKGNEAVQVYGTDETAHPGVAALYEKGDFILGGPLDVVNLPPHDDFQQYRLTPAQSRDAFLKRGWRRVVAFQTRNPIHRAHEYMQKVRNGDHRRPLPAPAGGRHEGRRRAGGRAHAQLRGARERATIPPSA